MRPDIWIRNRHNNLGYDATIEEARQDWIVHALGSIPREPLNELQMEMRYFVNILFHSSFLLLPSYYIRDVQRTCILVETMNDALMSLSALLDTESDIMNRDVHY